MAAVTATREELLNRVGELVEEERARLTKLTIFCGFFPDDPTVHRLGVVIRRARPRLLVVEDQIMDDLRAVLESEFDILPVTTLGEWNRVRDTLHVHGALIDRHLGPDLDSLGTTVIAEYLRCNTEIPAALMSVAPPPTFGDQRDLRHKYRLLEVVLKRSNGKLNEAAIVKAARALVDTTDTGWSARQQLWVESDTFHVEEDAMFTKGWRNVDRADECRRQADQLLIKLRRSPAAETEPAVRDFHRRWGRR